MTWGCCHYWNPLLQQWEPRSLLQQLDRGLCWLTTTTSNHIIATQWPCIPLLHLLSLSSKSDAKSTFPLCRGYRRSNLLTSPHVMWREEHLRNFRDICPPCRNVFDLTTTSLCKFLHSTLTSYSLFSSERSHYFAVAQINTGIEKITKWGNPQFIISKQ
jgi:hypothetical protein